MKYLVDANVLSEPTKHVPDPKVLQWLRANRDECVVDAIVMAEIWRGIDALPEGRKKEALIIWFGELRAKLQCLDWTLETALHWGPIVSHVKRNGFTIEIKDTSPEAKDKALRMTLVAAVRNPNNKEKTTPTGGVPGVNAAAPKTQ